MLLVIPIIKLWMAELMTLAILGRKQLNSHFKATLLQSYVSRKDLPEVQNEGYFETEYLS